MLVTAKGWSARIPDDAFSSSTAKQPIGAPEGLVATIRANCTTCGDIELTSADLRVRVCRDDSSAAYRFHCPGCGWVEVKDAQPGVVEVLVNAGVELETWMLPDELEEPRSGPPISHDDLLDFHRLLENADWTDGVSDITRS